MRSWPYFFGLVLCGVLGCKSAGTDTGVKPLEWLGIASNDKGLKPPKAPEQYVLPPESEARFTRSIEYPEGTLNQRIGKSKDGVTPPPSIGANNASMGAGGMGGGAMSGAGGYR